MRRALLSLIHDGTSILDKLDSTETQLSEKPPIDVTRRVTAAYELLLYIPVEYLPRTSRQDLMRRAMTADLVVCRPIRVDADSQVNAMRSMTILRIFMKRWFLYQSSVDHAVS
jgi:hypothetical protein